MIVKVEHSHSKPAWNVVGTVLGGTYKWARCPYVITGDDKTDAYEKCNALRIAEFIAKHINKEWVCK